MPKRQRTAEAAPEPETVTENLAKRMFSGDPDEPIVRLYPTHKAYIPGEPAIEREVAPEEAERLLAYSPAAYTTEPPDPPPTVEVEQPAEPVEQTGSLDSQE